MSQLFLLLFIGQLSHAKLPNKLSKGPPVKKEEMVTVVARHGDDVKLVCPVHGSPQPIVEWSKVFI